MSDPTRDPASVEIDVYFSHAPSEVWRALVEPVLVERWLMPSTGLDASVGTRFVFSVPPAAGSEQTASVGEIECVVLAVRHGEQLTLSWADLRAEQPIEWVVDVALAPEGHGTRLLLTHSGFDLTDRRQKMARNGMERMWRGRLARLRDLLEIGHLFWAE
ncbi:SRPBCC domain-containing protein [Nocardia sp. NPDC127579]|uniref:SRPBCC family protein n=1 Tax=Nocardia sp. NPDC127579 TaxID=3345402 RepID=UPI003640C150